MAQYLIKYIDTDGKTTIASPSDVFTIGGLKFGSNPQQFDDTTIALKTELASVSGTIGADAFNQLQAVSGALSQDIAEMGVLLQGEIDYVSGVVNDIITDLTNAEEVRVEAVSAGQTIFSVSGYFEFDPLNTNRDIDVFKNGLKVFQSSTGNIAGGDFQKISSTEIQFFYGLQLGDRVVLRLE